MKRRTVNLIFSLFSVFLAVALFGFGVYAATSATSTINSTFHFQVSQDDVFVDIVGSVSGCENDSIPNYIHEWQNTENFLPWNMNQDLIFKKIGEDKVEDVVYTFNFKNYNENKKIKVEFIDISQSDKILLTPSQSIVLDAYVGDDNNVPSGVMTMTLSLKQPAQSFSHQTFSFTIKIEIVQE